MNNFTLEIIGFTLNGCLAAQSAGAHRIELCDNATEGGTTPSYGFIKQARAKLSIGLYPIIRPRGGDFFYSDEEVEIMKTDIRICKELGCDGVVIGLLLKDGAVDKKATSKLVRLAYPMGVSFHRAFDRTLNAEQALEDIIETGCERILTSGQMPNAVEGSANIKALIKQADDRIIIMPGSGINANNILQIAWETGATEFHASARIFQESKMEFSNINLSENSDSPTVEKSAVKKMLEVLEKIDNT
ncbi:MAG: copper homeostasis protein CutC [Gloeobacteraceae cyanobacterium ES-bin-316]|nr:copper homeostasis protein CutC [Ferruginibacter sp.]